MSKLEEVARAIAQADERNGGPPYEYRIMNKHAKEHLFDEARAALSALLEPSPEMIEAATRRSDNGDRPTMYHSIWKAMVEAAMEK